MSGQRIQSFGGLMANDEVYAGGLLNRALDPATQPLETQAFLALSSSPSRGRHEGMS